MKYWISWYQRVDYSEFELDFPWWTTGWRCSDDAETICAAIVAESSKDAEERIYRAYDKRPETIEFRFVDEKPSDWTPFEIVLKGESGCSGRKQYNIEN